MKQKLIIAALAFFTTFGAYTVASPSYNTVHAQTGEININLGAEAVSAELPGSADFDETDGEAGFNALISNLLNIVLTIAVLFLFINLIWAGVQWISAGGDKSKIESARNKITQSVIGLIILVSSVAIFMAIQGMLGIEVLDFGGSKKAPAKKEAAADAEAEALWGKIGE